MNTNNLQRQCSILGILSISMAGLSILSLMNVSFKITLMNMSFGNFLLIPFFMSPIGFLLGLFGLKIYEDKLSFWGVVINILLFVSPIIYLVCATLMEYALFPKKAG